MSRLLLVSLVLAGACRSASSPPAARPAPAAGPEAAASEPSAAPAEPAAPAAPAGPPRVELPLVVAPAPITTEGHVAAAATDLVFILEKNADPEVPGVALGRGEALRIAMPRAFARTADVEISATTDASVVLTRGWPQGAVKLASQYEIGFDPATHTLSITALVDLPATIKAIHLRGRAFQNPAVGSYPVTVVHMAASGRDRTAWTGSIDILERVPAARIAPSNFHLPPGTSASYQRAGRGQVLSHRLGMLLWDAGEPMDGVGIVARDLKRFPRYTGGLLVQDTNKDGRLDAAKDQVVGGIIGSAPEGAKGQAATSPLGPGKKPLLSGQVLRDAGYPKGGGQPVPGLLVVEFRTGDTPGAYQPTFELIGGNAIQFMVRVTE